MNTLALIALLFASLATGFTTTRFTRASTRLMQLAPRSDRDILMERLRQASLLAASTSSAVLLLKPRSAAAAAAAATEADYISSLTLMILAKQILEPLEGPKGYIAQQAYDAARTNVKYLLNQLQIEKAATLLVRNSLDFSEADPDTIDAAQEQGSSLGNALIQLDSTIYTVIFIPGEDDGKPPPAAEKYIKMLKEYLANVNSVFDLLISLGTASQLTAAKKEAASKLATLPFKEVLFKKIVKATSI